MKIATVSDDATAKIWDAATGAELLTLTGHNAELRPVAFSLDGTRILTGSLDVTVKVWDAITGKALWTFPAPDGLTGVAFGPDGSQLAVGSVDGTNRIYFLRIEDLMALAKQRLTRTWTIEECQQYLHLEQCPSEP